MSFLRWLLFCPLRPSTPPQNKLWNIRRSTVTPDRRQRLVCSITYSEFSGTHVQNWTWTEKTVNTGSCYCSRTSQCRHLLYDEAFPHPRGVVLFYKWALMQEKLTWIQTEGGGRGGLHQLYGSDVIARSPISSFLLGPPLWSNLDCIPLEACSQVFVEVAMVTIDSARPPRHPEDAAKGRGSVLSDMGKSFTASMAALKVCIVWQSNST